MSNTTCYTSPVTNAEKTTHLAFELFFSLTCCCLIALVGWTFYYYAYTKNLWTNRGTIIFYTLALMTATFYAIGFTLVGIADYSENPMYATK